MANVALIVYSYQLNVIGVRSLCAYLKSKGHKARIFFMLTQADTFKDIYSEKEYDQVLDRCRGVDIVGLSITSNFHAEAVRLTKKLKNIGKPVVWGGIHPTLFPEECMKEVDIISQGESEEALLELVEAVEFGRDISRIQNLWVRTANGEIIRNPARPLIHDLDTIPYCDIDYEDHFALDEGELKPITPDLMKKHMRSYNSWGGRIDYYISTSRGCPHHCTYCCNDGLQELYGTGGFIRKRSAANVIRELEEVIRRYPFINYTFLTDEELLVQKMDFIVEFCRLYKEKIKLPLKGEFSPASFKEDKFKILLDAGMAECHLGIESGSDVTNNAIYKRGSHIERIHRILAFIMQNSSRLKVCYLHLIVHNPMEKKESTKDTFLFVASIDNFFDVTFFPLVFFPGTTLYKMALEAGHVKQMSYADTLANASWSELGEVYRADYFTIMTFMLYHIKRKFKLSRGVSMMFYHLFSNPLLSALLSFRPFTRVIIGFYVLLKRRNELFKFSFAMSGKTST